MPRRIKKTRPLLAPLTDNFKRRLLGSDARLRRRVLIVGLWVIGLMFLHSLLVGPYGIPRIVRLELERRSLIETNRRLTIELIEADRTRSLLRSNPRYIEYIARTRYRMVLPDETMYRYRGQ